MANHPDPESCGVHREVQVEALTGETDRPAIEPRNQHSGMPTLLSEAEGHMVRNDNRKSCANPTRSQTLCMSGSLSHGSSEISSVPGASWPGGTGKVNDRNPVIDADEKSDTPVVPKKLPNKGANPAEAMEGRGVAKGNANESPASRTLSRDKRASSGLEGVRETARRNRKLRLTALLHHVTPLLLVESFYALRKEAAAGVDGVTWRDYESQLHGRLHELHREIHTGAYRAQPTRRVHIPTRTGAGSSASSRVGINSRHKFPWCTLEALPTGAPPMEVGTKELRNRLSEILDRVEHGERVIVRRRGHAAVALAPLVSNVSRLPSLAAFRASLQVRGRPMSEEVVAARRDERA